MMANATVDTIIWVVPVPLRCSALHASIHLLSTLLGRHAVIQSPEDVPLETDAPVAWYSFTPPGDRAVIPADAVFWNAFRDSDTVPSPLLTVDWGDTTFPAWSTAPGGLPVDVLAATFYHYSRLEERDCAATDAHGRFPAAQSWVVKHGLIERPLIHEYARALATRLQLRLPEPSIWPGEHGFALAFSHDIDRLRMHGTWMSELRSIAGGILRGNGIGLALRRVRNRRQVRRGNTGDPYATLEHLARLHRAHEFGATFFWLAAEPSARDGDYRCDAVEIADIMAACASPPHECGLHGSYDSYRDETRLREERRALAQAAGGAVDTTRQHYLRLRADETWRAQQRAGLSVDSTLGYAERVGFRAGLAVPFRPWSFADNRPFDMWEVPLVMMDVTLKEYMRLTVEAAVERSRKLIETLQRYGAGASCLWHNSSLNEIDWPGWERVYDTWLSETRNRGGWGVSVGALADHWQSYVRGLGNDA